MSRIRSRILLLLISLCPTLPVLADFHLWTIEEIYSNADGSIQFIELASSSPGQGLLSGHTLVSSDGSASQTFTFPGSIAGDTSNARLLLATETFASRGNLNPDYIIPDGFVPRAGGTLNFGEGASTFSFTREQLPLNGAQSLSRAGQAQIASPINFTGFEASIDSEPLARFDIGSSVMNIPVLEVPGLGIANVSFAVNLGTLEFTLLDNFYLYSQGTVAGSAAARLEADGTLYVPGLVLGAEILEFNLALLGDNPIRFGNPAILSVRALEPEAQPEPEPEPTVDQASINRGQTIFNNQCVACHGPNGLGGIGANLVSSPYRTFDALRSYIDLNMPQTNPAACRDNASSTCATDAANYVLTVIQGAASTPSGPIEVDDY